MKKRDYLEVGGHNVKYLCYGAWTDFFKHSRNDQEHFEQGYDPSGCITLV